MRIAKLLENKKIRLLTIILSSFFTAFLIHLIFFLVLLKGNYMTGMNDGLSQMIPFKYLLYNEYTTGNFFYSDEFGLGGGIFSQLGYYFSTSLVFIVTVACTFILEKLQIIGHPDLFYWADTLLVISTLRMTLIIIITTFYFRYMKFKTVPAFIGAVLYGISAIYFRNVTFWEFFADALIFLPLLLIGVEKIMREKNPTWFIIAVTLSMIDNFYFAYVNFLLAGIYIVLRWIIPLTTNEMKKMKQVKVFLLSGLAGFGMSAMFFIPSVYGYLNNHRPPFEGEIPLFHAVDNILWDSRIVIVPVFTILCLFLFSLYKNRVFRFFAILTIVLMGMHYSPFIASVFNGFSAPQYRWEHLLSLAAGGAFASALQLLTMIKKKPLVIAILLTGGLYGLTYRGGSIVYLAIFLFIILLAVLFFVWKKNASIRIFLLLLLVIVGFLTVNSFQKVQSAFEDEPIYGVSKDFMMSEAYYGSDQRALIERIQEEENNPFARIDWMVPTRNNTPIVQDFKGMSVYSSILNKHLLFFYLHDLKIDMGNESVSRYASLGDRANLYSILNGKYYIAKKGKQAIPYGFSTYAEVGDYIAYKNENVLPFIRTTNLVFSEDDLKGASVVAKEQAMLTGIILKEVSGKSNDTPETPDITDRTVIEEVESIYEEGKLTVLKDDGGLDIVLTEPREDVQDYFVSFFIKAIENDRSFTLQVNDFVTKRKKNDSVYRTDVDDLTIRVSAADKISIRLPKGNYTLKNFTLHEETYKVLETAKAASDREPEVPISRERNHVGISYDNTTGQTYMALPIPFEKGWTAKINGEKVQFQQANYAFTGIRLQEGVNDIQLTYFPPYFFMTLICSIISLLLTCFYLMKRNRQK